MLNFLTNLRPTPYPNSFNLFGLEVAFYAVIILCGALICATIGYLLFAKKLGLTTDDVTTGVAIGLLCGIMGARLYYVIFNHEGLNSFIDIINPRNGGLAIHGGIIATAIFLPVFCKVKKLNLVYLMEIVVPIFLTCQVIGRWGNFMNQEAFGPMIDTIGGLSLDNIKEVAITGSGTMFNPYVMPDSVLEAQRAAMNSWLIPNFIVDQMYIADGWILIDGVEVYISGYYHPTFLYESLMNLLIVIFMYVGRKYIKKYYVGDSLGVYLIGYGIVRFIIESLRTDPLTIGNTGIKIATLVSVLFVVLGVLLLVLRRVFKFQLKSCHELFYTEGQTMVIGGSKEEVTNE